MNTFVGDVVILSYFIKYSLERCCMSHYCCIVVCGDTICHLRQEYHQLSPPFSEQVVSLYLCRILCQSWVWVGRGLDPIGVGLLSLPLNLAAVWQKVTQRSMYCTVLLCTVLYVLYYTLILRTVLCFISWRLYYVVCTVLTSSFYVLYIT